MTVSTSSVRVRRWPLTGVSVVLLALGACVFFLPLVGPHFGFGFDTAGSWRFSALHWQMNMAPGLAIFVGGVLMLASTGLLRRVGEIAVLAGGVWLLIGPSLRPVWSSTPLTPLPGTAWHDAWLWIAYFYGAGALAVYLAARAQAISTLRKVHTQTSSIRAPLRRAAPADDPAPAAVDEPAHTTTEA
jgi:hypothetical protein